MDILDIPNYAEAILKERVVRDAAFLGITESIGPFEVVPLTLRQWLILRLTHNPLIVRETPSPNDVLNFLWLLSPHYTAHKTKAKRHFERRCRHLFFPPRCYALWNTTKARARFEVKRQRRLRVAAAIIDAARAYVEETMQDKPPAQQRPGFEPDYFSDGAYFCALFGREYGWSQEETLNTPVKRLWQYVNELKHAHGSKVPLCNPSDRIRANFLRGLKPRKDSQPPNGH